VPPRQDEPIQFDPIPPPPDEELESDVPQPIGVPLDYTAPGRRGERVPKFDPRTGDPMGFVPGSSTPSRIAPRYFEGDEGRPAMGNPQEIWALQRKLVRIGLLQGTTFQRGVWDPASQSAYTWLLGLANRNGFSDQQMLEQMLQAPDRFLVDVQDAMRGENRPPLITQTTDPKTLRQVFRRSIIDLTGEGWTQAEIDQMVQSYNDVELRRQRQAYNLEAPGSEGGNVVTIPEPEAFIEAKIHEQDPLAIPAHEMAQFAQESLSFLSSPAWGSGISGSSLQGGQL
jgi:hypothetical protein